VSESEAFLAAICANPADDLPRLVYADWLDEHDQSNYAEFIRMQCEMARVPRYEKVWAYARRDEAWWLDGKPFYGKPPQLPNGLEFVGPYHRGLPYAVRCEHPDLLLKHAELIFRIAPIEKLVLAINNRDEESWWRFIRMPAFQRLQSLRLEGRYADLALEALHALREPTNVKGLELHGAAYDIQQLVRLVQSPFDDRLENLSLELTDYELRAEFFRAPNDYARTPPRRRLKTLEYRGIQSDLVSLREMLLRSSRQTLQDFSYMELHNNNIISILTSTDFPELRSLEIHSHQVNSTRILDYVSNRNGLRAFQLHHQGVVLQPSLEAFTRSDGLDSMHLLDFSHSTYGNQLARALTTSPHLLNLYELRLQSCYLTDEAGIALMNSPHLKNLITLNLKGNTFSSPIIAGLQDRFGEALVL